MYEAKVILDSLAPSGWRLTTCELTYPRIIHSEFMTHRMFSRNSASSRAIPIQKMIDRVLVNPFVPIHWGRNQKGMQAAEELGIADRIACNAEWMRARDTAVKHAEELLSIGVHKQIVNRLLEPFSWITVIVSSTTWANFLRLRVHGDAQPEIFRIASLLQAALANSRAKLVDVGDWHLPYVSDEEIRGLDSGTPIAPMKDVSAARCARVSYLTHDGKRDMQEDMRLAERLKESGHWSPFEHVAQACEHPVRIGNFKGWKQYRKEFVAEFVE